MYGCLIWAIERIEASSEVLSLDNILTNRHCLKNAKDYVRWKTTTLRCLIVVRSGGGGRWADCKFWEKTQNHLIIIREWPKNIHPILRNLYNFPPDAFYSTPLPPPTTIRHKRLRVSIQLFFSKSFSLSSYTFSIFPELKIKKLVLIGKILWRFYIIFPIWLIHFLFH